MTRLRGPEVQSRSDSDSASVPVPRVTSKRRHLASTPATPCWTTAAASRQLHDRLTVRLQYAEFKVAHDRIEHTLSELENLYLRPFRQQALKRHRERHANPQRQDWRDEAILADDERDGEQDAIQSAAGYLVFDGAQPSLGVVSVTPSEAKTSGGQTRKRTAGERTRTPWPERPFKRVARPSTSWRPFTRGWSEDSDRTWDGESEATVAGQETTMSDSDVESPAEAWLRLATNRIIPGKARWNRRSLPLVCGKDGLRADPQSVRYLPSVYLAAAKRLPANQRPIIRSDSPEMIPSSLAMGGAVDDVHASAEEVARTASKSLSPFSSRSTLESAGATLAPASSVKLIQPISSGETSPKLRFDNGTSTTRSIASTSFPAFTFPDMTDVGATGTPFPLQPRPTSANRNARSLAKLPDRPRSATVAAASCQEKSTLLVAHPSFSALPPVPPLPFDSVPVVVPFPVRPATRTDSYGAGTWGWQPAPSRTSDDRFGSTLEAKQDRDGPSEKERQRDLVDFSSSPGWPSLSSRLPESGERENRTLSIGAVGDVGTSRTRVRFGAFERVGIGDRQPPREAVEPYPPLSQETVLDSGASQDVAEATTSDDEPQARGRTTAATTSEADDTQETQDSQFSVDEH